MSSMASISIGCCGNHESPLDINLGHFNEHEKPMPSTHRGPTQTSYPCARATQARSSHQGWNLVAQSLGKCTLGRHRLPCTCPRNQTQACSETPHGSSDLLQRKPPHFECPEP